MQEQGGRPHLNALLRGRRARVNQRRPRRPAKSSPWRHGQSASARRPSVWAWWPSRRRSPWRTAARLRRQSWAVWASCAFPGLPPTVGAPPLPPQEPQSSEEDAPLVGAKRRRPAQRPAQRPAKREQGADEEEEDSSSGSEEDSSDEPPAAKRRAAPREPPAAKRRAAPREPPPPKPHIPAPAQQPVSRVDFLATLHACPRLFELLCEPHDGLRSTTLVARDAGPAAAAAAPARGLALEPVQTRPRPPAMHALPPNRRCAVPCCAGLCRAAPACAAPPTTDHPNNLAARPALRPCTTCSQPVHRAACQRRRSRRAVAHAGLHSGRPTEVQRQHARG